MGDIPESGYRVNFACQTSYSAARLGTVGLWGGFNSSEYWYNQVSYPAFKSDPDILPLIQNGNFNAYPPNWNNIGTRAAWDGGRLIEDATILEFTWSEGAYTMTDPEWDESLWVDEYQTNNPGVALAIGGCTDPSTEATCSTLRKWETVPLDGFNISFGGQLYGGSQEITLSSEGVIWMGDMTDQSGSLNGNSFENGDQGPMYSLSECGICTHGDRTGTCGCVAPFFYRDPKDLSNQTALLEGGMYGGVNSPLGSLGGIAWFWSYLAFDRSGLNPAIATKIPCAEGSDPRRLQTDEGSEWCGIAFSFRNMELPDTRTAECEQYVTAQVQLRSDNSVRIMYAYTGIVLSEPIPTYDSDVQPRTWGYYWEPARLLNDGLSCGQAMIPIGSAPAEGTCVFGAVAAEASVCEPVCGNDTATSETPSFPCTTITIPSADGAGESKSAWMGMDAMECQCQVSLLVDRLTCYETFQFPDGEGPPGTHYSDIAFQADGSRNIPWGYVGYVRAPTANFGNVGYTCAPVLLTVVDPSITGINIGRVPLLMRSPGQPMGNGAYNGFMRSHGVGPSLEVSCPVGYWQSGAIIVESNGNYYGYYYYFYSQMDDAADNPMFTPTPARCDHHGNWVLPECYAHTCTVWDNWTLPGINGTDCDSTVTDASCTVSCEEGYGEGATFEYTCSGVDITKVVGADIAVFSGDSVECPPNLCDESSLPSDAVTSNCSGARYLETCSVTCEPGYNNTGPDPASIFTCTISKDFNGTIDCIPNGIACDAGGLPSGDDVDISDCADTATAEDCTVSCSPGYSGDAATFLCAGSATGAGDFSGSITCTADPCDASTFPPIDGLDTTACSSIVFAETCSVPCQTGFSGSPASWSCDASGSFAAQNASCTANLCVPMDAIVGADATACSGMSTGQTCDVTCFQGYTGDVVTKTCGADGLFSGGSVSCIANVCESGLPSETGFDTSNCDGATTSQDCTVDCLPGYSGSTVTYTCGASGAFSEFSPESLAGPSGGPSADLRRLQMECSANECDPATLPLSSGTNTVACLGRTTSEQCTILCEQGYTADGDSAATCSPSGGFAHSIQCMPNTCDNSTLPFAVVRNPCQDMTTGMDCTTRCRPGYTEDTTAMFSCLSSGRFEGDLECSIIRNQLDLPPINLTGDNSTATITKELTFSVSRNAAQLIEELSNPSSEASQAVATSFSDAVGLPESAQVAVVSAESRVIGHERRLHHTSQVAAVLEVSGVNSQHEALLDIAMEATETTTALGAHLEQNLLAVENLDIGYVESVSVHPLPEVPVLNDNVTWAMEEEDDHDGCARSDHLLVMVIFFRFLCVLA